MREACFADDGRDSSPNTPQSRLETIQALLLLFAVGLWSAKAILHEALSLQSQLALLVREEGLVSESAAHAADWETFIRVEGGTRTKLIAYCFFNLCSIAYNVPPLLLTADVGNLVLPQSSRQWRAENQWAWQEARQLDLVQPNQHHQQLATDISLQEAFWRLFSSSRQSPDMVALPISSSSLGNYVLIHALIQHIFLLKQTSFITAPPMHQQGVPAQRRLRPEDVEDIAQALRLWQAVFEQYQQTRAAEASGQHQNHHQYHQGGGGGSYQGGSGGGFGGGMTSMMMQGPPPMGGDLFSGGGTGSGTSAVAFNSTALLRLAYLRLYTEQTPLRALDSRDPLLIAAAFNDAPLLPRCASTNRAVMQAVHALSVLVKLGVSYVARTKSLEWSIQHSSMFQFPSHSSCPSF